MSKNKKMVFAYFLGTTIFTIPIYVVIYMFQLIFEFDDNISRLILNIVVYLLLFTCVIYLFKSELKESFKEYGFKRLICSVVFYGILIKIISSTVLYLSFSGDASENQKTIVDLMSVNYFVELCVAGVIGPIIEEIVFRYIIMGFWLKRKKSVVAILFSSIIFACIHLTSMDLENFFNYFIIGLCFAIVYYKRRNICLLCGVHIFYNLSSMLIILKYFL